MGCCKEELRDYANVRAIRLLVAESANGPAFTNGTRTTAAQVLASVRLEYDYLAAAPSGSWFTAGALAWQCEEPGRKGLKDKITEVSFTSTGLFNGVAAGQPLNQFVRCLPGNSRYQGVSFPLAQLADSLNSWKSGDYAELDRPIELVVSPKPTDNAQQQFRLRLRLHSGKEVEQTTPSFIWQ
ncbi:hypothetical protein [Hymenobacter metallilatus]|uniref:Uncharacterized protein n=1 Tax=Hymenobacter metallilatus TaxID=2493666 RepID=A0A428JTU4_9BACT|nr:hypothetical protein [Hymenobacter metallilatus]RSK37466.1 hypothetical protein EI290_02105 [Hymenobacter metallilatus]